MNRPRLGYGWKVSPKAKRKPIDVRVFIPAHDAQWEYDLKHYKQSLRDDGLTYRALKRNLKAGGVEIETTVLLVYEKEVEA